VCVCVCGYNIISLLHVVASLAQFLGATIMLSRLRTASDKR
jgi:hypothetical protein